MPTRRVLKRLLIAFSLLSVVATAGFLAFARHTYLASVPSGEAVAEGVIVEGHRVEPATDIRALVAGVERDLLDRPIEILLDEEVIAKVTLRELGGRADPHATIVGALAVARQGALLRRYNDAERARAGVFRLSVPLSLPIEALADRLAPIKDELDEPAIPARRFLHTNVLEPHSPGEYIDVYRLAEDLLSAARRGESRVTLPLYESVPHATTEAAGNADVSTVVGSFETRFGGPPGRDKNIARATSLLDGAVLMPGDEVSFNEIVGARSTQNGFERAPEIYRGETRLGVGGGACQVASTLYAAAFFGGLDVIERRNHSRPSGYIRPGLDATVSYPVLDLRIKNPFPFPVVLGATLDKGRLKFEVFGREKPVTVELATETTGVMKFKRKVEKGALASGKFIVKQRGKNGMNVKRTKSTRAKDGRVVVEVSTDTYPATQEILIVGPDFDETSLPPLEGASPT